MPKLETLPEMVLTTADIKEATRWDAHTCPVALCLRRHYPNAFEIFVSMSAWIEFADSSNVFRLARPLLAWMERFDSDKLTDTMPFKLHINDKGHIDIKEATNVS